MLLSSDLDPVLIGTKLLEELELPETRRQQMELVEGLVRHWLSHGSDQDNGGNVRALCCEAPTGTGKTYAVLCAAFALYIAKKQKTVVSTFTKILETQYAYVMVRFRDKLYQSPWLRDLMLEPELFGYRTNKHPYNAHLLLKDVKQNMEDEKRQTGPLWRWSVLKGKRNYICYRRFDILKGLTKGALNLKFHKNGTVVSEDWGALAILVDQIKKTKKQDIDAEMGSSSFLASLPSHQLDLVRGEKWTNCSDCQYKTPYSNDKKIWCQYFAAQCKKSDFFIINHALLYAGGQRQDNCQENDELLKSLFDSNNIDRSENVNEELDHDSEFKHDDEFERKEQTFYVIADEGHHLMDGGVESNILYRWNGDSITGIYGFPLPDIPVTNLHDADNEEIQEREAAWAEYLEARNIAKSFWTGEGRLGDITPPLELLRCKDLNTLFSPRYVDQIVNFFRFKVSPFMKPERMTQVLENMLSQSPTTNLTNISQNDNDSVKCGFDKRPRQKRALSSAKASLFNAMLTAIQDGANKAEIHLGEFLNFLARGQAWQEKTSKPISQWVAYATDALPLDTAEAETLSFDLRRRNSPSGDRLLAAWRDTTTPTLAIISGTLTGQGANGPNLMSFEAESGIQAIGDPLILSSPFPEGQLKIWIPRSIPRPDQLDPALSGYVKAVVKFCVDYVPAWVKADKGGVLILSTSKTRMRAIWSALRDSLKGDPNIALFVQMDDGNRDIAKKFLMAGGKGILVASDTFREGFDAPGHALTWTILDRLPFLAPTGTVRLGEEILIETGRLSINEANAEESGILTPQRHRATIMSQKLAQCAGRVIRTATDKGMFTVLDSRLLPDGADSARNELIISAAERYLPHRSLWKTEANPEWMRF